MNYKYLFFSILMMTSCIKTDAIEVEKRVEALFNLNNFNQELVLDNDSLIIDEFKYLVDNFVIINEDSVLIEKSGNVPPLVYAFYENSSGNQLIFTTPLGIEGLNNFRNYQQTVQGVSQQTPLNDPDFFENDESNSLIIKGFYNNERFTIYSTFTFTKKYFNTESIELDDTDNTLIIQTSLDVRDVFIAEADSIINPFDESNISIIQNRFREYLSVDMSKGKSVIAF